MFPSASAANSKSILFRSAATYSRFAEGLRWQVRNSRQVTSAPVLASLFPTITETIHGNDEHQDG